ncbi:DUF2092 domain-containing protein [Variovorax sp. J22P240]|uniref:DUF2092 domain-containing protein n=1 Tax=unclassified Variovorax TaxID=663243 RepID=UPI0025771F29|nr:MULTISPECIES: DUF2092 domain-containing protein [unclassified Variovorax]MDM0000658.1 DUF2092 domain-containing protein [Variovorax sp. J22P240]MDM0053950.1 DUF2092 domain-containing protein [Variovorax sp. J22R115]
MNPGRLAASVLALVLTAPVVAQTAPAPAAPPAGNTVDPASIQALKDMGAYLQTLDRFRTSTSLTAERVLSDGQKLMHTASATVEAARPNRLRARMWSVRSEREILYDGKTVTLYAPAQKYYSTVEFSEPNSVLVEKLEEQYGVEIPMSDLFTWGTPAAPVDKIESAMNAGQDIIGNSLCDHYAFRQGDFDWQVWITTGGKPLPRKLVITNRRDDARPQSISVIDWNVDPSFNEATFKFRPPKGATRIEIVPVKSR